MAGLACIVVATVSFPAMATNDAVPEEFRSESAVVLEDSRVWTVDAKGPATFTVKKRILLQSRRGFDLADQSFGYSRPNGTVAKESTFLSAVSVAELTFAGQVVIAQTRDVCPDHSPWCDTTAIPKVAIKRRRWVKF